MKRFICYRENPPPGYYDLGVANPPEVPQFEGVEFSDGTVCLRWMTLYRSHSLWTCLADAMAVHGHPEYGTRIEWVDD